MVTNESVNDTLRGDVRPCALTVSDIGGGDGQRDRPTRLGVAGRLA